MWSLITALAYRWLQVCKVTTSMWFWKKYAPICSVYCDLQDESSVSYHHPHRKDNTKFSDGVCFWSKPASPWTLVLEMSEGMIPERSLCTSSSWASIGSTQIGILTLKQDFGIATILPFGMDGERSRKIRTVGINNPFQNCVCISQWFAVQHWRTE